MHEIDLKDYRAKPPRSGHRLDRSAKRFLGWIQDDYQGTPEDGSARLSSGTDVVRVLRGESWRHYRARGVPLRVPPDANTVELTRLCTQYIELVEC